MVITKNLCIIFVGNRNNSVEAFVRQELVWDPKSPEGEEGSTGHRLLVKTAILMPEAKEGEVNMVEVEGDGYNGAKVGILACGYSNVMCP